MLDAVFILILIAFSLICLIYTEGRDPGLLGEQWVNILKLNMALDAKL